MADFLFHEVSEKEKEKIRKEAKDIMDSFSKELSKIEKLPSDAGVQRDISEREEGSGGCTNISKDIMFDNAPKKNGDFIIAEKGDWND